MTSDLFSMFNGKYIDPNYRSSSTSRARMKTWDQRHESQPSWEEDYRDYESSEQVWQAVTCGNPDILDGMEYEVDHLMLLPEEKWIFIKNPRLTTEEVWQLCADESEDERDDYYDCHSLREQYEMAYDDHYDWEHSNDDYYDDEERDYDYDYDYDYHDSDHPSDVFYCHEEDAADERRHEAVAVWQTTCDEIARFDESCEPLQPEPCPLISEHHSRKAA